MCGTERTGDKEGDDLQTERQWRDRAVMVGEPPQRKRAPSVALGRAGDTEGQVQATANAAAAQGAGGSPPAATTGAPAPGAAVPAAAVPPVGAPMGGAPAPFVPLFT